MTFQFIFVEIAQPWILLLTKLFGDFPFSWERAQARERREGLVHPSIYPLFRGKNARPLPPTGESERDRRKKGNSSSEFLLPPPPPMHAISPSLSPLSAQKGRRKRKEERGRLDLSTRKFSPFFPPFPSRECVCFAQEERWGVGRKGRRRRPRPKCREQHSPSIFWDSIYMYVSTTNCLLHCIGSGIGGNC